MGKTRCSLFNRHRIIRISGVEHRTAAAMNMKLRPLRLDTKMLTNGEQIYFIVYRISNKRFQNMQLLSANNPNHNLQNLNLKQNAFREFARS